MEDGIDWNTPLLDKLLHEVTVVITALAVVHSHIPSAWIAGYWIVVVTYRVFFALSLTNGCAIIGILDDIFAEYNIFDI